MGYPKAGSVALDKRVNDIIDRNDPSSWLVSIYLMSSYAYYELDRPILEDGTYDRLCKFLLKHINSLALKNHQHYYLLDKENLKAGTGHSVKYPQIVRNATINFIESNAE